MFQQVSVPMGVMPFTLILRADSPYDGKVAVVKTPFFQQDILDNDEGQEVRGEFYPDFFRLTSKDSTDEFFYGQLYSYKYIPNLLKYLVAQNVQNPFPAPLPDPQPEPGWQPHPTEVAPAPEEAQNAPEAEVATTPAPTPEEAPVEAAEAPAEAPVEEEHGA